MEMFAGFLPICANTVCNDVARDFNATVLSAVSLSKGAGVFNCTKAEE